MPTLCLDFGNTRLKAALFIDHKLQKIFGFKHDVVNQLQDLLAEYNPTNSILSSVIEHPEEVEEVLSAKTLFHKLSNNSKLPFSIPVGKPETVGSDRLAISAATVDLFPDQNNLAIVLGSCITYNFINKSHQLIGGSISPGMEMRFRSLHQFTAKLPLLQGDWNVPLIGYDTNTNILSGIILGMAKEMDGIIDAYQNKFSNFNVLLTGGDLVFFEPHLKRKIFADPHLIFKGLYVISQINNV